MTVVVLTAVPPALRGVLTRWLVEIAAGVFVGHVSARVRDHLWQRITDDIGRGRAIMVHSARNEQRLAFRVHGHDWQPVDLDGVSLMLRPTEPTGPAVRTSSDAAHPPATRTAPRGWSFAERRLRGRAQPNPNPTESD